MTVVGSRQWGDHSLWQQISPLTEHQKTWCLRQIISIKETNENHMDSSREKENAAKLPNAICIIGSHFSCHIATGSHARCNVNYSAKKLDFSATYPNTIGAQGSHNTMPCSQFHLLTIILKVNRLSSMVRPHSNYHYQIGMTDLWGVNPRTHTIPVECTYSCTLSGMSMDDCHRFP